MPENKENSLVARLHFKSAIFGGIIAAITAISVALINNGNPYQANPQNGVSEDCESLKAENNDLKRERRNSMKASEFHLISSRFFNQSAGINEHKESLRSIVRDAEKYYEEREHYLYQLFLLKRTMNNNPRGNINTRIASNNENEIVQFKMIQQALRSIGYYDGPIDGNILATRTALERFQNMINHHSPGYIDVEEIGIFGNQTFMEILRIAERKNK